MTVLNVLEMTIMILQLSRFYLHVERAIPPAGVFLRTWAKFRSVGSRLRV